MKILLVALVVASGCICGDDSKPTKAVSFKDIYIYPNSGIDRYSKIVYFSCSLATRIKELYNSLRTTEADIAEITIVSEGKTKNDCEMWIKVPFKFDAKMIDSKDILNKLDFAFQGLLEALIKLGKVFEFEVSSNSFIYDPIRQKILFIGFIFLANGENNYEKLSKAQKLSNTSFIIDIKKKLSKISSKVSFTNTDYDYEIENYKVSGNKYFDKSLIKQFQNNDSSDQNKDGIDFPEKLDIIGDLFMDNNIRIVIKTETSDETYLFNKKEDVLSIYICQNINNNKGHNDCIMLNESDIKDGDLWSFNIKNDLRYEITIKEVNSLQHFFSKRYFKVFVTLMNKNARGIVTNTYLTSDKPPRNDLKNSYYLLDECKNDSKILFKDRSKGTLGFQLSEKPLKIANDIQIFQILDSEAKKLKFSIDNPTWKYYQLNALDTKTLVIKDETTKEPAEFFYLSQLINQTPIIRKCVNPYPSLHYKFEDNLFKLYYISEEKTYSEFLNLHGASEYSSAINKCIEFDDNSNYQLKYETGKLYNTMKFKWSFNSYHREETIPSLVNKAFLSESENIPVPIFEFKRFEFPKLAKKSLFISLTKMKEESKFIVQGIYFKEKFDDGVIIHENTNNLIEIPKHVSFNADGSIVSPTYTDCFLIDQKVNYLSDDEIVYNIANLCQDGRTPVIEISKDQKKITIDCSKTKNLFSSSNKILNNLETLSDGMKVVAKQLSDQNLNII